MKVTKIEERTKEERQEIAELLTTWLKMYTYEVIKEVMLSADEITSNETTMALLRELKKREEAEHEEFKTSLYYGSWVESDPNKCSLLHSDSYRNVLYDMYIRPGVVDRLYGKK